MQVIRIEKTIQVETSGEAEGEEEDAVDESSEDLGAMPAV